MKPSSDDKNEFSSTKNGWAKKPEVFKHLKKDQISSYDQKRDPSCGKNKDFFLVWPNQTDGLRIPNSDQVAFVTE